MKRKVIAVKYLPSVMPISCTWLMALSQKVFGWDGMWLGVGWSIVGLVWLIGIVDVATSDKCQPKWEE